MITEINKGKYSFLGNFYTRQPFHHEVMGKVFLFKSSEAAFMSGKSLDMDYVIKVNQAPNPGLAKLMGRQVKLRNDWEDIKFQWMVEVLVSKFYIDGSCLERLLETGDETIHEFNSHGDRIWGQTYDINSKSWIGENYLGKALMVVRHFRRLNQIP